MNILMLWMSRECCSQSISYEVLMGSDYLYLVSQDALDEALGDREDQERYRFDMGVLSTVIDLRVVCDDVVVMAWMEFF